MTLSHRHRLKAYVVFSHRGKESLCHTLQWKELFPLFSSVRAASKRLSLFAWKWAKIHDRRERATRPVVQPHRRNCIATSPQNRRNPSCLLQGVSFFPFWSNPLTLEACSLATPLCPPVTVPNPPKSNHTDTHAPAPKILEIPASNHC